MRGLAYASLPQHEENVFHGSRTDECGD